MDANTNGSGTLVAVAVSSRYHSLGMMLIKAYLDAQGMRIFFGI